MHIKRITPELMVDDVQRTIDFYTETLGFLVENAVPSDNPFFVILKNGECELMLYQRNEFSVEIPDFAKAVLGGSFALYIHTENVKELYDNIHDSVKIVQPLHQTDYGTWEFSCLDCNGYVLMFH